VVFYRRLRSGQSGDHQFCLDNSFSHFSNKVVFFELFIDDNKNDEDEFSLVDQEDDDYEYKLEDFKVARDSRVHCL
jgi:hypothetical protein